MQIVQFCCNIYKYLQILPSVQLFNTQLLYLDYG